MIALLRPKPHPARLVADPLLRPLQGGALVAVQLAEALNARGDAVTDCRPATESEGEPVAADRRPMDLEAYEARVRNGPCFICAFVAGDPGHVTVYEDDQHIAFLDRYPTVPGKVLVAPKAHIEHAVRDLEEPAYLALMSVVRKVALAVEAVSGAIVAYGEA
ncbi:HIT family protein [Streptomyces sp. NPDC091040]|uniref:HIT family protein n=1 Tax=Streptomyces sp. NPDC091040 TaxID=3365972 RepID=UPI00382B5FA8